MTINGGETETVPRRVALTGFDRVRKSYPARREPAAGDRSMRALAAQGRRFRSKAG